jgi:glucose/arabinose dehydrogenase
MPTPPLVAAPVSVTLAQVATGFNAPLDIEQSRDNTGRLFVVQQAGQIRILQNGAITATPFLDISSKVPSDGETGLLGLTFHPNYSQNRLFSLNYDRTNVGQLQTVIAEYQASTTNPNVADPNSEHILLVVNQSFPNHKAGQLGVGPPTAIFISD